ncbi:hypothetical protein JYU34_020289 [Plutella xylostella]|uniref:Ubiquitin-like domain-containing protein n=1 Tax=Plutella xylostella TaxID=51655 RepID=A0ABQ7PU59_PLUXY|nr:hypothetical protein JYU34_020289 [Plutella xylostella]
MIPDNVTLIVKAPNQQIEDQNIQCQSSWTVKQLKGYLSEVYPSKPSTDEQKIIYSGQLLDDTTILKDVLRIYESQIGHTMHLVCTPRRRTIDPKPTPAPTVTPPETDGVRRRHVAPEAPATENVNRPETRQNDQNHTVEMQNYLTSFVNNYGRVPPYPNNYSFGEYLPVANDPASMANHMMMMQQAYMQYMQQYANMWQAGNAVPGVPPMNGTNDVPAQPPAPEAPAVPPENAEDLRRDWLDHIYAASRLAVLFSLVYLYSSPFRLLLVMLLVAAGYLHQIGFFRELAVQANNEPPANQPPQPAERNNANENVDNATPPEPPVANNANNVADNDNQQSILAVSWMIFSSFFASLIPEMNQ